MALRELSAMGNCGCACCLRTYSRREYNTGCLVGSQTLSQLLKLPYEITIGHTGSLGDGVRGAAVVVLGYGGKGRETFGGETGVEALIDQEEVKKMEVSHDAINLGQLH